MHIDQLRVTGNSAIIWTMNNNGNNYTTGTVGIGLSNPPAANKLEVYTVTDASVLYLRQGKNSGGTGDAVFIRDDRGYGGNNDGTTFKLESWRGLGKQGGVLANFLTIDNGFYKSRFYINNDNGRVGIGTDSPDKLLQLNSNDNPTLAIGKLNANTGGKSSLTFYAGNGSAANGFTVQYLKDNTTDRLGFVRGGAVEHLSILNNGNVGVGTRTPTSKLSVGGTVHAKEVKVDLNVPVPDYVFEKNYNLRPLAEVENYINQNKHLPEVPAAKEMEANGVNLGEMNMLLLKKVEELTLYVIELKKEIEKIKNK